MGVFPEYESESFDPNDEGHLAAPYPQAVPPPPPDVAVDLVTLPAPEAPVSCWNGWLFTGDNEGDVCAIPIANIHRVVMYNSLDGSTRPWQCVLRYDEENTNGWHMIFATRAEAMDCFREVISFIRIYARS